jgi:hypothetical protein
MVAQRTRGVNLAAPAMRSQAYSTVIPGRAEGANPESRSTH